MAHFRGAVRLKIAEPREIGDAAQIGRVVPVVDGRHFLADGLTIGGRLVPTDAGHRVIVLSIRVSPQLPGGGTRAPSPIAEHLPGLVPRYRPAVLLERLCPVLALLVPAPAKELLELPVRHLVLVDPVVVQLDGPRAEELEPPSSDGNHVRRRACNGLDRELKGANRGEAQHLLRLKALAADLPDPGALREAHSGEGRGAEELPGIRIVEEIADVDPRVRRRGTDGDRQRRLY